MERLNRKDRRITGHAYLAILLGLLAFGLPERAEAAIAVDGTVHTGSGTGSPIDVTHTVSGSDRLMLVGISAAGGVGGLTVSSVVWDPGGSAQTLTLVGTKTESASDAKMWIYQFVAPATGTKTLRVSFGGSDSSQPRAVGVISFTGVDQTTPLGTFASDEGLSGTASVDVSSAADEVVFDTVAVEDAATISVGGDQSQQWNVGQGVLRAGGSTEPGASSVTMSWSLSSSEKWAIGAVQIHPVSSNPPVGGYTVDNVIPAAQISQSTDGLGIVTINWKGRDDEADNVTLKTFEYSVNGGSTWNAPTNGDASSALSTNWDDNGGAGWSTATTFASATAHTFTFDTQHADVTGLDGVDQSDVRIRFKLNDGGADSEFFATSEDFQVDNEAPTSTITSFSYSSPTNTMTITGTNFLTIAAATTDVKTYVDWTKFVWDINGDDATTSNITFVTGDVTSLVVTNDTTLTLAFTSAKGTAIESTTDYGDSGGADTFDVTAGFSKDAFGNAATTDGTSDATLTIVAPQLTIVKSSTVISDPINGGTNPLRIPGAVVEFSVLTTNNGNGSPDNNSLVITDPLDGVTLAYDVTTGVTFTDGSTSSGLALGTVEYSQTAAPGPYVYDYTPVPDGDGFDGNVTSIKVNTTGTFTFGGAPAPSFTVKFRAKVK